MWKRTRLYITRKIGRNSLFAMICMCVAIIVLLCLGIRSSVNDTFDNLRKSFGGSFTVRADVNLNTGEFIIVEHEGGGTSRVYAGPQVNEILVDSIKCLEGIKGYNAQIELCLYAPEMKLVPGHGTTAADYFQECYAEDPDKGEWRLAILWPHISTYMGNKNTSYNPLFLNGSFELVEGRHIVESDREKILISEEVARLNDYQIGDHVRSVANATIMEGGPIDDIWAEFDFEIVGIYKVNSKQDVTAYTYESDIADNFIFTDLDSMLECRLAYSRGQNSYYDSATFLLEDPAEIDQILEQAKNVEEVKNKPFLFEISDEVYQESAGILTTLNTIVTILLVVVIVGCLAILSIILTMWIQNRRREAGILLSIGIERREIIAQFMAECLIIGLIAVVLAAGVSSAVNKPVSNAVLSMITPEEEEIETRSKEELTQELLEGDFDNLGGEIHTEVKLPEEFNSTVTIGDVVLVLLIEAMLIIATVYVACYRVLWMKPKDILTMMS